MHQISDEVIASALAVIQRDWTTEHDDFTNGDCHTLAVALYQAMGNKGKLVACLRESDNEDGSLFSTGYSHMVYEAQNGVLWDIGGRNADIRWEESFDFSDVPDEDGLVHRFRWEEVPYSTYQSWLQEYYGCIDNSLTGKITLTLRELFQTTPRALVLTKKLTSGASLGM